VGDRVATLVSLTLTPLVIEDGLARWDGRSEQVPCDGYAVLFGRSIAARIPDDLPPTSAWR
jgi:L-erythro-3,5-diaminohexanoate dehydrogenase